MSDERTIKPNTPADFTPQLGDYKTLQPFRYWCQKVLPLVYDDSLSYYELLCKVVDYLNKTMEDVETLHVDVTSLHTAYTELESYVNNYFDNLDVQQEINNKLDNMAKDGSLTNLIKAYIDPITNEQNKKITVLENRMDTFASLPEGSTSGNAELIDIRVPANGFNNNKPYPTAGDAVRGQTGLLKRDLSFVVTDIPTPTNIETNSMFTKLKGINANVTSEGYIALSPLAEYDTYYSVITTDTKIYFDNFFDDYTAFLHGDNYTNITENTILCTNAVRFRSVENNMPTLNNPYSVKNGDVIAITVKSGKTVGIYGFETSPAFSEEMYNEFAKNENKNKIAYIASSGYDSSTERLEIYTPTNNGFIKYDLLHCVDSSKNANVWRMGRVFNTDKAFNPSIEITTSGEWELAIKLNDRPDFSGGILHGSEVLSSYTLLVDGVITSKESLATMRNFNTFELLQSTTLYDPNDETTIIGYHHTNHKFNEKGFALEQSTELLNKTNINVFYIGMLPASKSVFNKYFANNDYTLKDLRSGITVNDATEITLLGEKDNIFGCVSMDSELLKNIVILDNSTDIYYKVYFIAKDLTDNKDNILKYNVKYKFGAS